MSADPRKYASATSGHFAEFVVLGSGRHPACPALCIFRVSSRICSAIAFCLREKRSIPFITSSRCALSLEYNAAKSELCLLLFFIIGS